MSRQGIDLGATKPKQVDASRHSLAEYHVIVGLNQPVRPAIGAIPFRTSALHWDDLRVPQDDDAAEWEELYRTLAVRIQELMTLLRGAESA